MRNQYKANLLYACIDRYPIYQNRIHQKNRSLMNVVFNLTDVKLEAKFVQEATVRGLLFLAGHAKVGGMRASIYNSMPVEGVKVLVSYMEDFAERYCY